MLSLNDLPPIAPSYVLPLRELSGMEMGAAGLIVSSMIIFSVYWGWKNSSDED